MRKYILLYFITLVFLQANIMDFMLSPFKDSNESKPQMSEISKKENNASDSQKSQPVKIEENVSKFQTAKAEDKGFFKSVVSFFKKEDNTSKPIKYENAKEGNTGIFDFIFSVFREENTTQPPISDTMKADLVMIVKSQNALYLSNKGKVFRTYRVALGSNPIGPKVAEGDKKTPEGFYTLDFFKCNSTFYKAFHISYPNAQDIANARKLGRKPGGQIMIHGQPNNRTWAKKYIKPNENWTAGCIALLNNEMDELLKFVEVGTPILIKP
ncbi:MAG: L,D-transpeptidase family protein [Sulfurovum sp.]|jgi:lipoprotein-anchoring transpeptidase ErfK/SrfK|nr:L,D-transpeptidase family protein [Sulfurovum sp.]